MFFFNLATIAVAWITIKYTYVYITIQYSCKILQHIEKKNTIIMLYEQKVFLFLKLFLNITFINLSPPNCI